MYGVVGLVLACVALGLWATDKEIPTELWVAGTAFFAPAVPIAVAAWVSEATSQLATGGRWPLAGENARWYVAMVMGPLSLIGYGVTLTNEGGVLRPSLGVLCAVVGLGVLAFDAWYVSLPVDPKLRAELEQRREKSWIHRWRQRSTP